MTVISYRKQSSRFLEHKVKVKAYFLNTAKTHIGFLLFLVLDRFKTLTLRLQVQYSNLESEF